MSLPREPRQKMINMMYLVLTALLALNVSAEILNAFKTVNRSLETTNVTVNNSTETIMSSLKDKLSESKTMEKAKIWFPKAQEAQKFAKEAYNYIQDIKNDIVKAGGGDVESKSFKADNLDIATRLMIDKGKGKELQKRLIDFQKNILGIDRRIDSAFGKTLPINTATPKTDSKSNNTFERAYFHMVPTVAALTILSKFQSDIKTSENKVIQYCHDQVGAVVVRFDKYVGFAATDRSYIMPGDKMTITAGIGAFSQAAAPQITIDGAGQPLNIDGVAEKDVTASSALGKHTVRVNIKYTDLDGAVKDITKEIEYTVGQAAASIALDKMNVLYIGVDNPITISTTGAGAEQVQATMTGAGGNIIKNGGGKFTAKPTTPTDECWITVTDVNGKVQGRSKFRVRNIPKPVGQVGPYESGSNVSAAAFRAQAGVAAYSPNFPFELTYRVTSFTISADSDDGYIVDAACTGNTWSQEAQRILNDLKSNKTVMIDEIRAVGPDGVTKKLPSLVYYIK